MSVGDGFEDEVQSNADYPPQPGRGPVAGQTSLQTFDAPVV
jgi:hypothetical protein